MLRSFWEELISPYSSILGRIIAGFLLIVVTISIAAIVAITIGVALGVYDSALIAPAASTTVVVEDKQVKTGSSRLIYINQLPIFTKDPDKYFFHFKIEGQEASIKVSKEVYHEVRVGDLVSVSFGYGRLFGDIIPIDLVK